VTRQLRAKIKLHDKADFMATAHRNMIDLQLRRISQGAQFGEFFLDFPKMELSRADQPIRLTVREFKVLKFLVSRPRVVVSRQRLIASLWPDRKRASRRAVDNCIVRLRQKIEDDPDCPALIQTVHGVGYKFVPPETMPPS